jgi:hypothetical protein
MRSTITAGTKRIHLHGTCSQESSKMDQYFLTSYLVGCEKKPGKKSAKNVLVNFFAVPRFSVRIKKRNLEALKLLKLSLFSRKNVIFNTVINYLKYF